MPSPIKVQQQALNHIPPCLCILPAIKQSIRCFTDLSWMLTHYFVAGPLYDIYMRSYVHT